MEIIGKLVHDEKNGVTVEFVGEGGEVVLVHLKKDEDGKLHHLNAEEKAKAVMVQIATFDTVVEETLGSSGEFENEPPSSHSIGAASSIDADDSGLSSAVESLRSARAGQDTQIKQPALRTLRHPT